MLYNHARVLVENYTDGEDSFCPQCESPLIAKRGEIVVWHWAHKANTRGCSWEETEWHLTWKMAYASMPDWVVEYPISIEGKDYRLDAYNPKTGRVREFVHTLSKSYYAKHLDLLKWEGHSDILWIWHGEAFESAYKVFRHRPGEIKVFGQIKKPTTCGGPMVREFFKKAAFRTFLKLGGFAHWRGSFWRHWKANVWFPFEGRQLDFLLSAFSHQGRKLGERTSREKTGAVAANADGVPENPDRPRHVGILG